MVSRDTPAQAIHFNDHCFPADHLDHVQLSDWLLVNKLTFLLADSTVQLDVYKWWRKDKQRDKLLCKLLNYSHIFLERKSFFSRWQGLVSAGPGWFQLVLQFSANVRQLRSIYQGNMTTGTLNIELVKEKIIGFSFFIPFSGNQLLWNFE